MRRQSVISQKKKRGPPPTGKGEPVLVRVQPDAMRRLDLWISKQDDAPSRPEAIRRLVELGLASASPAAATDKKAAAKASKLAGQMIDMLGDGSAPAEERETRKRRLLKGPPEFREMRKDHPNKD
jgi:hypothetical protein